MTGQIPLIEELGDPQARRDDDFYETPRWQTEALLKRLLFQRSAVILEPCAGNGAIVRALRAHGHLVLTNDLVLRDFPLNSQLDVTQEKAWLAITRRLSVRLDAIITNLPFFLAMAVLQHAGHYAPIVATILRRTWDEPVEDEASGIDRGEWLALHPCTGQIVLPRTSYRGVGGDSATTAWFVWGPEGCVPPHAVVSKRERDELIAHYGKD